MTENKRFKLGYVCGDFGLIDNDEWIDLHSMSENSEKNVQICINKMNELHEENQMLKEQYADDCNEANSMTLRIAELSEENEQLKQSIDNMGGRLQGLWANYNENRYGIWSEAIEDIAKELGFKIYKRYDIPVSNSDAKKERINGIKKVNEVICENEQLKLDKQQLHRAMSREEIRYKQFKGKVFDLIDEKIKEADDGLKQTYDSWYQGKIDVLGELKKELSE